MASEMIHSTPPASFPVTLPISLDSYMTLVLSGKFEGTVGQIELINGRIVQMNPQGPQHADPVEVLSLWSFENARHQFNIRVQLPLAFPELRSCPEPDISWVTRQRYRDRFPVADEVHLLIEISNYSGHFDRTEKMSLYAAAGISEYWRVDVPTKSVEVYRDPDPDQAGYRSLMTYDRTDTIHPRCLDVAVLKISELFPEP